MKTALLVTAISFLASSLHAQNGNLAWAKKAGGNFFDEPNAITVDTAGNVFTTGYFRNTATFGTGEANEAIIPALGQAVFVAKHSRAGSLIWVRQIKSQMGLGTGIGVDTNGNSYVFGYFSNTLIFADGQTNEITLNAVASFPRQVRHQRNFRLGEKGRRRF